MNILKIAHFYLLPLNPSWIPTVFDVLAIQAVLTIEWQAQSSFIEQLISRSILLMQR